MVAAPRPPLPVRRPWLAAALVLAGTAACAAGLPSLRRDVRISKVFPQEDARLRDYAAFQRTFGSDDVTAFCALELPGDVLAADALARIHSLTLALKREPLVDAAGLVSLSDVTVVRAPDEETVAVGPLWSPARREGWDPEAAWDLLRDDPGVARRLLSPDRRVAGFWIPLEGRAPDEATRREFAAALRRFFSPAPTGQLAPDEEAHLEGFAITNDAVLALMTEDTRRIYPLAALAVLLALVLTFRRLVPALLALGVVSLSAVWTLGLMGHLGIPLSFMSTAIPVMLLVVSVGDAVHLIARFHLRLGEGLARREALSASLTEVGRACLYTSLTTAAGFGSLAASQVEIVRELGVPVAIGVLAAYVVTVGLLPPLLLALPAPAPGRAPRGLLWIQAGVERVAGLVTRRPGVVVLGFGFLLAADLALLPRVSRETRLLQAFDDDAPLIRTRRFFEERLGGVAPLEVVIDAGRAGRAIEPDVQAGLLELSRRLRSEAYRERGVLSARSLADFLAHAYHSLNERRPEARGRLPDSTEALAQLHLLYWGFAGRDPTRDLVDRADAPRVLRVALRVENLTTTEFFELVAAIEAEAAACLPDDVTVRLTGMTLMAQAINQTLVSELVRNLALAFASIGLLVLLCFRSLRLALLALAPNLVPLLLVLGLLALSGTALDLSTSVVFSIVFGIGVDDTIHVVAAYAERRRRGQAGGVAATLRETGSALAVSTAVLVAGFSLLALSEFPVNRTVGLLVAATCVLALAADLLLLPALLTLLDRPRASPEGVSVAETPPQG